MPHHNVEEEGSVPGNLTERAQPAGNGPVPRTETIDSGRIVRSLVVFALVGVILYGAATLTVDYRNIARALAAFPLTTLIQVLGLVLIGWILRALRFHYYLRCVGVVVPLSYSIAVFLASFALTGTPGKMGEAAKGVLLKEDYGIPITNVVGILVIERLLDLWAVLLLAGLSFLLFPEWGGLFAVCAVLVLAGGAFLCLEGLYRPVLERLSRISFLSWVCRRLLGILLTGRQLMKPGIFAVGVVLSVCAWGLECVCFYLILQGFGLSASLLEANFVYSFSTLVGALSMLPGGLGGTEAAMVALLAFLGIEYVEAVPAVLLIRLSTLWFAIVMGVVFMIGMLVRSSHRRRNG